MAEAPRTGLRRRAVPAVTVALIVVALAALAVGNRPSRSIAPVSSPPAAASSPSALVAPGSPRSARAMIGRPRAAGAWPGANGLSGVNGDPRLDTASVQRFCAARGRPCPVAHTYTDRTGWESMTRGTTWTFDF